jgi:hypothetical protein
MNYITQDILDNIYSTRINSHILISLIQEIKRKEKLFKTSKNANLLLDIQKLKTIGQVIYISKKNKRRGVVTYFRT